MTILIITPGHNNHKTRLCLIKKYNLCWHWSRSMGRPSHVSGKLKINEFPTIMTQHRYHIYQRLFKITQWNPCLECGRKSVPTVWVGGGNLHVLVHIRTSRQTCRVRVFSYKWSFWSKIKMFCIRCPDKLKFVKNPMNIIDFLAVVP